MNNYLRSLMVNRLEAASLFIRLGLAFTFIYAGISAFIIPSAWISYIPDFTNRFIEPKLLLDLLSISQLALAVWLVFGIYIKFSAIMAALFIGGLMITNLDAFLITFRDVSLLFSCAALYLIADHVASSKTAAKRQKRKTS